MSRVRVPLPAPLPSRRRSAVHLPPPGEAARPPTRRAPSRPAPTRHPHRRRRRWCGARSRARPSSSSTARSRARCGWRRRWRSGLGRGRRARCAAAPVRIAGRVVGRVEADDRVEVRRRGVSKGTSRRRGSSSPKAPSSRGGSRCTAQNGTSRTSRQSEREGRLSVRIGIPKEIKDHEYRVGMIPAGVHALVTAGHEVVVQDGRRARQRHPRTRSTSRPARASCRTPRASGAGRDGGQGQGAGRLRVRAHAHRPDPLHLPPPGAAAGADRRAAGAARSPASPTRRSRTARGGCRC